MGDNIGGPNARMDTGFMRVGQGERMAITFPYDEVIVVTKGAFTIRAEDETMSVRAGEVVYVPIGSIGEFEADEDVEAVAVTYPPGPG